MQTKKQWLSIAGGIIVLLLAARGVLALVQWFVTPPTPTPTVAPPSPTITASPTVVSPLITPTLPPSATPTATSTITPSPTPVPTQVSPLPTPVSPLATPTLIFLLPETGRTP